MVDLRLFGVGDRRFANEQHSPVLKWLVGGQYVVAAQLASLIEFLVVAADFQNAGLARIVPQGVKSGDSRMAFEEPTDGDLAAIVEFVFIFAVARLGILRTDALEVGVDDVVKNDPAAALKKPGLGVSQRGFDGKRLI